MTQESATATNRDTVHFEGSGVSFPPKAVDGMQVVDRHSHLIVLTELGEREPGRGPQWLSAKKVICPKCGRMDYGNVNQKDLVMCGLCLANECLKADRAGMTSVWKHPENHKAPPESPRGFRLRLKGNRSPKAKVCEKCGQSFRGRSNRQRFCSRCQGAAKNDRNRAWMQKFRNGGETTSLVDV